MNRGTKGTLIALSVAALFTARTATAETGDKAAPDAKKAAKVHCSGVNECKGKGECASASNSCGGTNSCKGKGIMMMSADDCKAKGGKVVN
jgi:hypothetical protein